MPNMYGRESWKWSNVWVSLVPHFWTFGHVATFSRIMGICWRVLLRPCLLAKSFYSRQFAACDMIPSTPQYASSLRLRKHLDASKSKVKGMLGVPGMLRGWWSSNKKPTCEDSGGSDGSHRFPGAGKQQVRSFIAIDLCLAIFFSGCCGGFGRSWCPAKLSQNRRRQGSTNKKTHVNKSRVRPSRTRIFQAFRCWMSGCWSILLSIELIPFWKCCWNVMKWFKGRTSSCHVDLWKVPAVLRSRNLTEEVGFCSQPG